MTDDADVIDSHGHTMDASLQLAVQTKRDPTAHGPKLLDKINLRQSSKLDKEATDMYLATATLPDKRQCRGYHHTRSLHRRIAHFL